MGKQVKTSNWSDATQQKIGSLKANGAPQGAVGSRNIQKILIFTGIGDYPVGMLES